MDGVQELVGVTIVAATNRPDVIVGVFSIMELQKPNLLYSVRIPH